MPEEVKKEDAGDDYGIRNDQILDICDTVISELWERIYISKQQPAKNGKSPLSSLSLQDIQNVAMTVHSIWDLAQQVLELDDTIRWMTDFGDDEDDDIPLDLEDEEDTEDDDEETEEDESDGKNSGAD